LLWLFFDTNTEINLVCIPRSEIIEVMMVQLKQFKILLA